MIIIGSQGKFVFTDRYAIIGKVVCAFIENVRW